MRLFAIAAALVLAVLPTASLARECTKDTANLCEPGFVWDHEASACVEIVSS